MKAEKIINWQKRASAFLRDNIAAHLILRNGVWLNGYISKVYEDYFVIVDREDGRVPVFFADIRIFETYRGDLSRLKKLEGVTNATAD